jgi:hypothetical protein
MLAMQPSTLAGNKSGHTAARPDLSEAVRNGSVKDIAAMYAPATGTLLMFLFL